MDRDRITGIIDFLPVPIILAETDTGQIVHTNPKASEMGFQNTKVISEFLVDQSMSQKWLDAGNEPANYQADISIDGCLWTIDTAIRRIDADGQDFQMIVINTMRKPGDYDDNATVAALCEIYARDGKNALHSFLQTSAVDIGAFSAAVYEKRKERYVIRDEWRSRRSVTISILSADYEVHPEQEMARIGQIKRAAGLGYAHFIKLYGTQGVLVYFFDDPVGPEYQPRIEKFARLLRALSPDAPRHGSIAILKQGLDSLRQGIAIWDRSTKKLLYENKVYNALFGGSIPFEEDYRGIGPTDHTDAAGRHFRLNHTVTRLGTRRLVTTHASDVTRYLLAEQKLAMTAKTDALTGLYNRRAGLEMLKDIYIKYRKTKRLLTVGFADIDGLKLINDTFGHGTGDAMIRSAADVLKRHVGKEGTVCRLGGDEFILILPDISVTEAMQKAEQIKNGVSRCFVGGTRGISISFGFKQAEYTKEETAESLVSVADSDMYRDKRDKPAD